MKRESMNALRLGFNNRNSEAAAVRVSVLGRYKMADRYPTGFDREIDMDLDLHAQEKKRDAQSFERLLTWNKR